MTAPLATAPNPNNVLLGRGKIFGDRLSVINGVTTKSGEFDMGNCTTFEITPKADVKEKYESMDANSSLYQRAVIRQTHSLKITGDEYSLFNVANVLMGSQGAINVTGATISGSPGETVYAGTLLAGAWYALKFRNVSAVTPKIGAVALIAAQDYNLDTVRGRIQVLASSVGSVAITNGGSGYTTAPTVAFSAPPGSGTQATGTAVLTGTVVTSVTITNPGSGYTSAPTITFTGGGGTNAAATSTMAPLVGTLTAGYTYSTYSLNTVAGGNQSSVDMYIRFLGAPVKGPTFELEAWHCQFTPSGNLGFIVDDFGNWTIEGMVLLDNTISPDGSLYRLIQTA